MNGTLPSDYYQRWCNKSESKDWMCIHPVIIGMSQVNLGRRELSKQSWRMWVQLHVIPVLMKWSWSISSIYVKSNSPRSKQHKLKSRVFWKVIWLRRYFTATSCMCQLPCHCLVALWHDMQDERHDNDTTSHKHHQIIQGQAHTKLIK